jgi:hypothetical protein
MIKTKSIHPRSALRKFTVTAYTTASTGYQDFIMPYPCTIDKIEFQDATKNTSARTVSVRNITLSESYLHCATYTIITGCVAQPCLLGMSASDAFGSGAHSRPFVSALSLIRVNNSSSKGDFSYTLHASIVSKEDREQ